MTNFTKTRCLTIAESSGFFKSEELKVLADMFDQINAGGFDYILLTEEYNQQIAGFIILGPTDFTESGWDIYWLAVDNQFQRKGIGRRLIAQAQKYVLSFKTKAVLRIETSGRTNNYGVCQFYQALGFELAGRIPQFYANDDDLLIYYKTVNG